MSDDSDWKTKLDQQVKEMRAGKVRQPSEQQARWIEWYKNRFEAVVDNARNGGQSATFEQWAIIDLIEVISRRVSLVAYGGGIGDDRVLKQKIPGRAHLVLLRRRPEDCVRPGDDTAAFIEDRLRHYQPEYGYPEDIKIVAERYYSIPGMQYQEGFVDKAFLTQHDFDYSFIVQFPE